jgi:hypothetical protein
LWFRFLKEGSQHRGNYLTDESANNNLHVFRLSVYKLRHERVPFGSFAGSFSFHMELVA